MSGWVEFLMSALSKTQRVKMVKEERFLFAFAVGVVEVDAGGGRRAVDVEVGGPAGRMREERVQGWKAQEAVLL